jgi:hypothetical protein
MSSIMRRRSGLTAAVASAMGWSPGQGLVSATKPSHQEAIPANTHANPASAGSFNPSRFIFRAARASLQGRRALVGSYFIGPARVECLAGVIDLDWCTD